MRVEFYRVSVKAVKRWKENGKPRQQTRTFMQTINPFNKNSDGSIKTREDIMREILAERKEWMDTP